MDEHIKAIKRTKSRVRAKIKHTSGVISRVSGFQKVRHRGPARNLHRPEVSAALTNLYLMRRRLLSEKGNVSIEPRLQGAGRPSRLRSHER